jgi:hypothetical protein
MDMAGRYAPRFRSAVPDVMLVVVCGARRRVYTKRLSAWQAALAALLILGPGNYLAHRHSSASPRPAQLATYHASRWKLPIGVTGTGR